MTLFHRTIAVSALLSLVAGCNGGSGRLTGNAVEDNSIAPLDGAADVNGGSNDATDVLGDSSDPTLEILTVDEGVAIASLAQSVVEFASSRTSPLLEIIAMAEQFAATAISDTVIDSSTSTQRFLSGDCSAGGSIAYSSPPLQKENLVSGDEVTLTFKDCAGTRMLLNGTYTIKVESGATQSGNYSTSLHYSNYSADAHDGATSLDVSGTIHTAVNTTVVPERFVQSSPLFNLTLNGSTAEISSYAATIEHDATLATATYQGSYDLRIDIPDQNSAGMLNVSVDPPYQANLADIEFTRPIAGAMRITGAKGASILAESSTENPETLLLDVNGTEQVMYWSDL